MKATVLSLLSYIFMMLNSQRLRLYKFRLFPVSEPCNPLSWWTNMANFRSPWYYNYPDDKHIGVNLSREYDKPVSIPFRAALFYAQPILAPQFSSCRWAASTRVPDDSDNPTLTEVPRPGAKTVLIEWYHLRCFQKRAFLREWRKERWDNMEPKKYFAPRETKS